MTFRDDCQRPPTGTSHRDLAMILLLAAGAVGFLLGWAARDLLSWDGDALSPPEEWDD